VLKRHPSVRRVRLGGSRASGSAHDFSDWDFIVETADFPAVERAMPTLVAPLEPLAQQWDRFAAEACYMLMLAGPTKIDLIFPSEAREWSRAWEVRPETLEAIDQHFWDWIVWLEQKRSAGASDVLRTGLEDMHRLMLAPMGNTTRPSTVSEAMASYSKARDAHERNFGVRVRRRLEDEVRPVIERRQR
jgi:hypothetical protein